MRLKDDGRLEESTSFIQHSGSSVDPGRQKGPHAHSINLSPDNRFAIAADLGLDELLVYRFDPKTASLAPSDPPFVKLAPGSGPRHFAFHTGGKFAYAISEMKNTVTVFSWDASRAAFSEVQMISTLPSDFKGQSYTAEVQVHPSGRFLYGSNRGHDSIAVFAVDGATGRLALQELVPTQGKFPRNFGIDPTGSWLFAANQRTNNIVVFRINTKNGSLSPAGKTFEVGAPVCVKFVPAS
jgi:6-phosphogluconolactonase